MVMLRIIAEDVSSLDIETVAAAAYNGGYMQGYGAGRRARMLDMPVFECSRFDCLREWPAAVFKFEAEAGYLAGWELGNYHAHAA